MEFLPTKADGEDLTSALLRIRTETFPFWAQLVQGQPQTGEGKWLIAQALFQVCHVTPVLISFQLFNNCLSGLQKFMNGSSEGSGNEWDFRVLTVWNQDANLIILILKFTLCDYCCQLLTVADWKVFC